VKVYYPEGSFVHKGRKIWYDYLLKGFEQAKVKVEISESMQKESMDEEGRHGVSISAIDIEVGNKRFRVWYDWGNFLNAKLELIKKDDLYYKIQCDKKYLDWGIIPIGQVVTSLDFINDLERMRKIKDTKDYKYDIIGVFRATNYDLRIDSVRLIRKMRGIRSLVGVAPWWREKRTVPEDIKIEKLKYMEHLELQCRSKICLGLAGNVEGGFAWRDMEILGMGCCLASFENRCVLPGDYNYFTKKCQITIKDDKSDLIDKINYYLKHDDEREEITRRGLKYYNDWLTPAAMVRNIIDTIWRKV